MRLVTFQSVYEGVLGRLGLDPRKQDNSDDSRKIADKISKRADRGLNTWDFTEYSRTEERAWRMVWSPTIQMRAIGDDGKPDEFYYLGDTVTDVPAGYYRVLTGVGDPPIGTIPTNTAFFEKIDNPEHFIERDQLNRRPIRKVHGVYKTDPSTDTTCCNQLSFQPSERGIKVFGDVGETVFIWYAMQPPRFSTRPFITGKLNPLGSRVYYQTTDSDGNCYRSKSDNTVPPNDTNFWILEPMPEFLANYIEAGAYADCLRDSSNGSPPSPDVLNAASMADNEAEYWLHQQIDNLISQGQTHFYGSRRNWLWTGIWASQPWGGDKVVPLTSDSDADGFQAVAKPRSIVREFHPEIVSILGPVLSLAAVDTSFIPEGSIYEIAIGPSGNREDLIFQLLVLPANPLDGGQVAPNNYNLITNNKHWEKIG